MYIRALKHGVPAVGYKTGGNYGVYIRYASSAVLQ